jgi:hypothetical protein
MCGRIDVTVNSKKKGFSEMQKLTVLLVFFVAMGCASAQSLKPEAPYPLKAGINKGTADSLVGTQYWYFFATPGSNRVTVRFKPMALYGAPLNTALTVTLYDEKRTWHVTKIVSSNKNASEATFTGEKLDKKMKVIISVAPPKQNLIRMGGDYEIEATGDVGFDEVKSTADPIIRTYDSKVNDYGATKFLADGTVEAANGSHGTWKAFDPENRIYTILIDNERFSLQYLPGTGLVKPGEPGLIVFQELRR